MKRKYVPPIHIPSEGLLGGGPVGAVSIGVALWTILGIIAIVVGVFLLLPWFALFFNNLPVSIFDLYGEYVRWVGGT